MGSGMERSGTAQFGRARPARRAAVALLPMLAVSLLALAVPARPAEALGFPLPSPSALESIVDPITSPIDSLLSPVGRILGPIATPIATLLSPTSGGPSATPPPTAVGGSASPTSTSPMPVPSAGELPSSRPGATATAPSTPGGGAATTSAPSSPASSAQTSAGVVLGVIGGPAALPSPGAAAPQPGDPGEEGAATALEAVGGLLGQVPPLVAGGSLLLLLALALQVSGALVWVPVVRRTLGPGGTVGRRLRRR